jgi:hypothetical protein
MLREPQHERKIINNIKSPSVRPELGRRTPNGFFSTLLVLQSEAPRDGRMFWLAWFSGEVRLTIFS